MGSIRDWIVERGIKTYGAMIIRHGIMWIAGFLAASKLPQTAAILEQMVAAAPELAAALAALVSLLLSTKDKFGKEKVSLPLKVVEVK